MTLVAWIFLLIYVRLIPFVTTQTIFRYQCPIGCFCIPDNDEMLIISCRWQKMQHLNELFPKNVTKSLTIQCSPDDSDSKFKEKMFNGFNRLQELKISNCKINFLEAEIFNGLHNLRGLHLLHISSMPLKLTRDFLQEMKLLERLSIIDSSLEIVENEALCYLKYLQILNLSENRLQNAGIGIDEENCILDHLIIYDLSMNQIAELSASNLRAFPAIRQLKLSQNGLKRIDNDSFKHTKFIQNVDLDNNELAELVPLPDSITQINLANNRLTTIPASVANLLSLISLNASGNLIDSTTPFSLLSTSIEMLDLSKNSLSKIPLKLFRESVDTITTLNLAQNNITEIRPYFLQNFTRLKELDLSKNQIKSLTDGIFRGLNELTTLLINDNRIYHVDIEVFNDLDKRLTKLNMANNLLIELPMAIGRLSKVKEINISGNKIKTMYMFMLNKIHHLTKLDLSDNDLEKIERYIFSDSMHLSELILRGNKITQIDESAFEKCPKLHKIDLAENQLGDLNNCLKELDSLRFVNISNNQLSSIKWENFPSGLQQLYVNNNQIKAVNKVGEMALKILHLRKNNLQTIETEQLPSLLEEIDIGENQLQQISKHSFDGKTQLKSVNIQHNSLKMIPDGIFEQSEIINNNAPGHLYIAGNPLICNCEMAWIVNVTSKNSAIQIIDIHKSECVLSLTNKVTSMHNVSNNDFLCRYNKICEPGCICCQFGNCDCKSKCPDNCECFRDNNYKINIVKCHPTAGKKISVREIPMFASHIYLTNANIPILRSHDFIGRTRLSQLHIVSSGLHTIEPLALNTLPKLRVLNLSGNSLQRINGDETFKTQRLQKLNIEENNINDIDRRLSEIMPNLEVLHAAGNAMEDLPDYLATASDNEKLKAITLGGNPFRCDCSTTRRFKFQAWFQTNQNRILDAGKIYCVENVTKALSLNDSTVLTSFAPNMQNDLFTMPITDFLYHENRSLCVVHVESFFGGSTTQSILLASFLAIVVIIIITALFYMLISALRNKSDKTCSSPARYKMTNSITSSADHIRGYSPLPCETMNNFDVFISYSRADEQVVMEELCRPLECQDFSVFLLHRDGKYNYYNDGWQSISDELNHQVQACKTLIMFITKQFLEKEWKTVQIKTAHHLYAKTKNRNLIAILSEEVDPNELSRELGKILLQNTTIQRSNPLFWRLLMSEILQNRTPVGGGSETSQVYSDTYDCIVPSEIV